MWRSGVSHDVFPSLGRLVHHEYIVFQTQNWSWSVEKNNEGILLQRGRSVEDVAEKQVGHRTKKMRQKENP
jgi:hypothetical protein